MVLLRAGNRLVSIRDDAEDLALLAFPAQQMMVVLPRRLSTTNRVGRVKVMG